MAVVHRFIMESERSLPLLEIISNNTILPEYRNVTEPTPAVVNPGIDWRIILPLYCIIFGLSVIGNGLVIATLARNRRMRTVTNVYLLNLAVCDLLLGVICMPFTLIGQVLRKFIFGAFMCRLIPYLQAVSVSVDVWTLVAISLERYFAICRPLESRRWQTRCHAYKMIALVWILSLAWTSPILAASRLHKMKDNAYKCREVWASRELEQAYNIFLDGALLVAPVAGIALAYAVIVGQLWQGMQREIRHNSNWRRHLDRSLSRSSTNGLSASQRRGRDQSDGAHYWLTRNLIQVKENGSSGAGAGAGSTKLGGGCGTGGCCAGSEAGAGAGGCACLEFAPAPRHVVRSTHTDRSIHSKKKVIRMLFVIVAEFFICWTPIHAINTIYLFYPDGLYDYIGSTGISLIQLLAYSSSCCNPITYCFMNRKFRQAFLAMFRCYRRPRAWLFGGAGETGDAMARGRGGSRPDTPHLTGAGLARGFTKRSVLAHSAPATELEPFESEDCV